jgi:predicted amidohydrolase
MMDNLRMFLAAVLQLNCTSDAESNWRQAEDLVRRAAGYGARLIATPENTNFLGPHDQKVERAESLDGPTCSRFSSLAADLEVFLLLGSFNETSQDPGRCHNTSVLFHPGVSVWLSIARFISSMSTCRPRFAFRSRRR